MIADELIIMAQVLVAFTLAFIVLPLALLPRPESARSSLDIVVIHFIRWTAIVIIASHVLAILGVYNAVTIGVLLLTMGWFTRFRRELGGMPGLLQRLWPAGEKTPRRHREKRVRPPWRTSAATALLALPVLAVLGLSYWIRVRAAIGDYTLAAPDAYIHLTWARDLANNRIWSDGVYPQGMAAFTAFVDLFAPFTHVHDVARFLGPLLGTLLVFAVYYAVVRLTHSPGGAVLAAGAFGLFGAAEIWRIPWHRQVGILPQELGLVLAILALPVAVLAVTDRGGGATLRLGEKAQIALGGSSLTVGAAGLAIGLTHPIPGAALLLIVGAGALAPALLARQRLPQAFGLVVTAGASFVLGAAVQPLAEWIGPGGYLGESSVDRIGGLASRETDVLANLIFYLGDLDAVGHSWLSLLGGACAVTGLLAGVWLSRSTSWGPLGLQIVGLSAAGLAVVALWDARILAQVIPTYYIARLANVFAPLLAIAIGAGLGGLTPMLGRLRPLAGRALALSAAGILVGLAGLVGLGTQFPAEALDHRYERETIEYDAMPAVTRSIRRQLAAGTYTIAGFTHQRPLIAGDGFFIELWVFARDAPEVPPDEVLPVPTPHTFVFVELEPFDAPELDRQGPTEEYYYTEKRGRMMARLYAWAEERLAEDEGTTIHFDDGRLRVYRISRNPAIRVDLERTEVFQDYTYEPGELFNDGPASPREVRPGGGG